MGIIVAAVLVIAGLLVEKGLKEYTSKPFILLRLSALLVSLGSSVYILYGVFIAVDALIGTPLTTVTYIGGISFISSMVMPFPPDHHNTRMVLFLFGLAILTSGFLTVVLKLAELGLL